MYKIPPEFNIDLLKGELITQISFGLNNVTFFFSKGLIQFSGSFSVVYNREKFIYQEVYPVINDFGLLRLLEKFILKVNVNKQGNILSLEFEENIKLQLIGNTEYESYTIITDEGEFIV